MGHGAGCCTFRKPPSGSSCSCLDSRMRSLCERCLRTMDPTSTVLDRRDRPLGRQLYPRNVPQPPHMTQSTCTLGSVPQTPPLPPEEDPQKFSLYPVSRPALPPAPNPSHSTLTSAGPLRSWPAFRCSLAACGPWPCPSGASAGNWQESAQTLL